MPIIDDHIEDNDSRSSGRSPLLSSMNSIIHKRRNRLIIACTLFIIVFTCTFLATFFLIKKNSARKFRSGLIEYIETEHSSISSAEKIRFVDELIEIHKTGKISNDSKEELDIYIDFNSFNEMHGKIHKTFDTRLERFLIFRKSHFSVRSLKDKASYTLELNKFADMSDEEFMAIFQKIEPPKYFTHISKHIEKLKTSFSNSRYLLKLKKAKNINYDINDITTVTGEDLDWRRPDALTPIKDQGHSCGSCWAFSSIASVESVYKLYKDRNMNLSEQELINCDSYSNGCNGGLPYSALEYIHSNGVSTEEDVPYHGMTEKCKISSRNKIYIDSITVTRGIDVLNKSLVLSPTVVAIGVDPGFKLYKSGIYTGKCAPELNHAVLLVGEGYDEKTNKRYWVIKNSWGSDWGENGYLRLERLGTEKDKCGILSFGINPVLN